MKSKLLTALLVSIGLVASPLALAQKGKKAAPAKASDIPSGPADASAFGGYIDDSPAWFKKTDEAIAQLTDLIRSLPDGDVKATRMIQLAELQWQKSSRLHLRAVREFNKKYDAWFMAGSKGREPKLENEASEKESDAVMGKAVKIYEHVIKKYPRNSRGDQAHYYLGQSYLQLAQKDRAIATFKKLTQRYPKSEFIPDAFLALGEFFFDNKKIDDAIENYTRATKYPDAKNWGYSKYKLAWAYMNKGDYNTAIVHFKDVVKFSLQPGQNLEYKEQALKDLVGAYTEVGNVEEAEQYFKSVGGETYFVKFLEIFAARLFEQGRDDESIRVYKRLIALEPMGPKNLTYEGEILKAYIRKADRNAVLAQLDRIVQMVDEKSPWVRQNQDQMEDIKRQRDSLEGTVSKYAREVFEESKKLARDQKYRGFIQAERFCKYYLDTFPHKDNAYPIRMMLAETQYAIAEISRDPKEKVEKFAAAMETYIQEVEADPKGKHLALAAESAIFAAEEIVKVRKPSPRPDVKDKNPRPVPGPEADIIRACDIYVKHVPKGPKAIASRYKAAYLAYEFNQHDDALKRFEDVVKVAPGTPQARYAADLMLDIFNIRNDPKSVNVYAKSLLKVDALVRQKDDDGKLYRNTLQEVAERSDYKICELDVAAGKHADAAACFMNFGKMYPGSDLADEAYYSASVGFVEAGQVDKAIAVREDFIKRFPDNERTPEVINYLGTNYRKVTNFERASDYYEMLATRHPKYEGSCDALYNAAFFRENLGEVQKAVSDYRLYLKQCGKRDDAHEVLYAIALIYERKKDDANATKTFEEYLRTYGTRKSPDLGLEAQVKVADILYGNGKKKDAYAKYQAVIDSYRRLVRGKAKIGPTGLGAAAKSAFYVIEPKYNDYNAVKLDNKKTLAANIKKRLLMIKPLRDSYEKVVLDYKHGEWAVAALYQIGKMSDDFVAAVKASPMPEELKTDAQRELYLYELGEQFRPVEEAAIEYYIRCLRTSYEYRIYNDFTRKAKEALEKLRPSQYVPDTEFRLEAGPNVAMFESSPIVEVK